MTVSQLGRCAACRIPTVLLPVSMVTLIFQRLLVASQVRWCWLIIRSVLIDGAILSLAKISIMFSRPFSVGHDLPAAHDLTVPIGVREYRLISQSV